MRNLFENHSYLVPISRNELFIDKVVYLESNGNYYPRLVFAYDHDKETSVVLRNRHYVNVSYPIDRIYEVVYL